MRQAQISIEYIVLIAVGFIFLIFAVVLVGDKYTSMSKDHKYRQIQDLAYGVQSELYFAARATPGYERDFFIPFNLNGVHFNITNTKSELIVSTAEHEFGLYIPSVTGNVSKGTNTIRNTNGSVCIEPWC